MFRSRSDPQVFSNSAPEAPSSAVHFSGIPTASSKSSHLGANLLQALSTRGTLKAHALNPLHLHSPRVDTLINLQGWTNPPPLYTLQSTCFSRFDTKFCILLTISNATTQFAPGPFNHATTLYPVPFFLEHPCTLLTAMVC
jgi:hypothetical protein